jgi:hypothetical protein
LRSSAERPELLPLSIASTQRAFAARLSTITTEIKATTTFMVRN